MHKKITLLRHGKTGLSGKYVGSLDVALSDSGRDQIELLGKRIDTYSYEKIFSSTMLRCRQSSEILFPNRTVCYDNSLREVNFGRWEGKTFQEISKTDSDLVDLWNSEGMDYCFPDGECINDFTNRVHLFADRLKLCSENNIIVISHGGVIRTLLCYFLNLTPSQYLLFQVNKGHFSTIDLFDQGAVLTGFNLTYNTTVSAP